MRCRTDAHLDVWKAEQHCSSKATLCSTLQEFICIIITVFILVPSLKKRSFTFIPVPCTWVAWIPDQYQSSFPAKLEITTSAVTKSCALKWTWDRAAVPAHHLITALWSGLQDLLSQLPGIAHSDITLLVPCLHLSSWVVSEILTHCQPMHSVSRSHQINVMSCAN